ncbi:MAG: ABC transporter permease subunit [Desulfobacterales bacterium]|nr:ABC transporter permease subunit [Desulfobacterales bacterium]
MDSMGGNFQFKYSVMWESIPVLMTGVKLTILIAFFGLIFGFLLGSAAGLGKTSRNIFINKLAGVYVESVRGTPLMVQVMFLYFGLPLVLGMRVPPLAAGITAIAVNAGAYIAEIVRGAVQSIDKGQVEAGRSIGLTHFQALVYIIWPQAFKRMIPPLGNQFIISLKDTSLLVVIGVGELTRQGQEIIAVNFRAFEVWLTVAIIYLVMTMFISKMLNVVEKKLEIAS